MIKIHMKYLKLAINEAYEGMRANEGGPFGAIIVKDNKIIGRAHNTVLISNDPTAHAEVNAIRHACRQLSLHRLTGAVLYTNFEPCPMCLAAIYWADIRTIFFATDRTGTGKLGFMDKHLYEEFKLPPGRREITTTQIEMEESKLLQQEWLRKEDRILY